LTPEIRFLASKEMVKLLDMTLFEYINLTRVIYIKAERIFNILWTPDM